MSEIEKVIKRNGQVVAFHREKIADAIFKAALAVGGKDRKISEKLAENVVKRLTQAYPPPSIPSVEEVQDVIEKELIEDGHAKTAKAFILYRADHSRLREGRHDDAIQNENIPYKKIWQILTWSLDHNCESVGKINKHIEEGTFVDLIHESDKAYYADINSAAHKILKRIDEIRVVIIAGPSSSGKTTTTIKVEETLKKEKGVSLVAMNLDNYFFDLEKHPKDEFGDYDFETPEALDLKLINRHLAELLEGKTIGQPIYNFKTGKREKETTPLKVEKNQIILLDSLHGLFEPMTSSVPANAKFKLYIETLAQIRDNDNNFIRWTDVRLLRRMMRDSWHRSYNPEMTLTHWHYVRRSELKNIIPFIGTVDHIINGALPYELPVHKKRLFQYFPGFVEKYKDDPKRTDAYIRAKRVHDMLSSIKQWDDEDAIAKDSLLREYIGGSIYKY
jgi:uridine kinase